mmetsp:Transcript_16396/g.20275  ORF Transcript_16396/g.20275 Transcript_16396/m.20275 type:complete len:137 (+) Transcript_16396:914-1324(+)
MLRDNRIAASSSKTSECQLNVPQLLLRKTRQQQRLRRSNKHQPPLNINKHNIRVLVKKGKKSCKVGYVSTPSLINNHVFLSFIKSFSALLYLILLESCRPYLQGISHLDARKELVDPEAVLKPARFLHKLVTASKT